MVAGGGVAGLAAALALARTGRAVTVLERADAFEEVGAGLHLSPNGSRVVSALGLWPQARAAGLVVEAVEPTDALTGRRLARYPADGRSLVMRRAALLDVLLDACRAAGVRLRTGARVAWSSGEMLTLDGGEALAAPLLVGADGLHSVLRARIAGARPASFTGQVAWRGLVRLHASPVSRIWMAPGRHVVTYPLPGGLLNVVAVREEAEWTAEGWTIPDEPASVRAAFADCCGELRAILDGLAEVRRWGLHRHPVAERWHDGTAVLVGDAAHPTLPFLAQGANLALEDAWVLAREVARRPGPAGLDAYQSLRRPRALRAVAAADAQARKLHLRGPARVAAHWGLRALGRLAPGLVPGRLGWLYGFDATAG